MPDWEKCLAAVVSVVGWNAWLTREVIKRKVAAARIDQKVTDMHGWMRSMKEDIKEIKQNGSDGGRRL